MPTRTSFTASSEHANTKIPSSHKRGIQGVVGRPLLATGKMIEKIVSGGQTGVDRAALDAAMALGIEVGGWCPKGRRALDGAIPSKYPLKETRGKSYQTRTRWNVRDSDATLIICRDEPTGGTALTIKYCEQLDRPFQVYQLKSGEVALLDGPDSNPVGLIYWLNGQSVQVLNVAGPREGKFCPIYDHAYLFLCELFNLCRVG